MAQNVRRGTVAADHGILQIEIDRQLRGVSLQQTQHVLCLVARLVVRFRVGVQIHAIRDAEPLTGGNICTPLAVILCGQIAAKAAANDRKIDLPRNIARDRIMGRRVCKNDGNHPNNIFIDAIKPNGDVCRVCGGELTARADDQDEAAINKRHDIYYDDKTGTLAAAHYFKALAEKGETKYIVLNGQGTIDSIKETLIKELGLN